MVDAPEEQQKLSHQAQVRLWIKGQVDGAPAVRLPDLTDRAVEHFSKQKPFIRSFLAEQLRPIVYEQARIVLQDTRRDGAPILLGDELVNREEFKRRATAIASKWSQWIEHSGDRHIRLLDMTRADLLAAAEERYQRGQREMGLARLWRKLAAGLGDGEVVRERFTPEQIEEVLAALDEDK